jgi:hypothetical protein
MFNKKNETGVFKMKGNWVFGCVVLLVFGLMITGCNSLADRHDENNTWSDIISLDQMNGTWKGSYSQSWTKKEAWEADGQSWTSEMETNYGDMRETFNGDIIYNINSIAKTSEQTMISTYILSGGTIDTYWPRFSAGNAGREGITLDDSNHSITYTTVDTYSVDIEDFNDLQINQDGTKIKVPARDRQPEIILIKN